MNTVEIKCFIRRLASVFGQKRTKGWFVLSESQLHLQKPRRLSLTGNTVINIAGLIPKRHPPFQRWDHSKRKWFVALISYQVIFKPFAWEIQKNFKGCHQLCFSFKNELKEHPFPKMDTFHFGKKAFICQYFSANPCATEQGTENSASGSGRASADQKCKLVVWKHGPGALSAALLQTVIILYNRTIMICLGSC